MTTDTESEAEHEEAQHDEHPTPECPNCGGMKTRPLDDEFATCFDCDDAWMMDEQTQKEVSA
jgi:hypothetical protein